MEQHSVNSKRNLLLLDSVVKNQKNLQNFMSVCDTENNVARIFREVAELHDIVVPVDEEP